MKNRKLLKIIILILVTILTFLGVFIATSPYIFKNSSLRYKRSNIEFSKTFWDRDICSMNKWDKTTRDTKDLRSNNEEYITDFFFSPGLDKCLYKLIQIDKNGLTHYFIKETITKDVIYEISPYNPLQRIIRQYHEDYFNKFAERVSEIPNVADEVEKINNDIAANGPQKKCAKPEELRKWIEDCNTGYEMAKYPSEEFLISHSQQCNDEEQKKTWVANYILIDPNSFGFTRGGYSESSDKYVTGSAAASNMASQNDLLKSPLYYSAFWDGECWNLTKLSSIPITK